MGRWSDTQGNERGCNVIYLHFQRRKSSLYKLIWLWNGKIIDTKSIFYQRQPKIESQVFKIRRKISGVGKLTKSRTKSQKIAALNIYKRRRVTSETFESPSSEWKVIRNVRSMSILEENHVRYRKKFDHKKRHEKASHPFSWMNFHSQRRLVCW